MTITGSTRLIGVMGNPIGHSLSPNMHNAALAYLKLNMVYIPLWVQPELLKSAIEAVRAFHFLGVNVTIPFKEKVIPFLDRVDKTAAKIGAVNTIINEDGCLVGYNTDGEGFMMSVTEESGQTVEGKKITLLGAGGSAKAIGFSMIGRNIHSLVIINRTIEKAIELEHILRKHTSCPITVFSLESKNISDVLRSSDIIVNTTSVGMEPNDKDTPVKEYTWVSPHHFCCDIIYKPRKTEWLREVENRGGKVLGGSGMLVGQGAIAFRLFTGYDAPFKIMKKEVFG